MSKRDYYEILGVAKTASADEIKQSYRKLAMKYHPDRNQGDPSAEAKFKEVQEAYDHLSDPDKKRIYDSVGHEKPQTHRRQWTHGSSNSFDMEDFIREFTRGGGFAFNEGVNPQKTHQVQIVSINLRDAFVGRVIAISSKVNLNIPKGVRSGTRFYHDGKLFQVDVLPHPKFKRAEDDLLVEVQLNSIEAMLGVEIYLEHLDGSKLQFTIPAGIQPGQVVKLSNKGMKNPETDKQGDILVRVNITTPKGLTDEEKNLLKTLQHRESINI